MRHTAKCKSMEIETESTGKLIERLNSYIVMRMDEVVGP